MIYNIDKSQEMEVSKHIICMAIYKAGAFAPLISGAIGGTIFSHNSSGSYIKNIAIPANPRTIYQVAARNLLTNYAQAWRGIVASGQAAWNAAAPSFPVINRFGDVVILSGFNLFCQLNINANLAGGTTLLTPPSPGTVIAPLTFTATVAAGVITFTFTASPVPTGQALFCWATPGQSLGKSFVKSQFRMFHVAAAAVASPLVVTTFYTARFGAPLSGVGQKLFFQIQPVVVASGLTGIPTKAQALTS